MLAKLVAGFLAMVGAVSAFVAMLSLRRMERRQNANALLKARQEAQVKNEQRQAQLKQKIEKVNEPLRDLGDSRADRDELAALLDK